MWIVFCVHFTWNLGWKLMTIHCINCHLTTGIRSIWHKHCCLTHNLSVMCRHGRVAVYYCSPSLYSHISWRILAIGIWACSTVWYVITYKSLYYQSQSRTTSLWIHSSLTTDADDLCYVDALYLLDYVRTRTQLWMGTIMLCLCGGNEYRGIR